MTFYFTIHIYKHILGLPESLTESPSTSISSSGASGVNPENLAMKIFVQIYAGSWVMAKFSRFTPKAPEEEMEVDRDSVKISG